MQQRYYCDFCACDAATNQGPCPVCGHALRDRHPEWTQSSVVRPQQVVLSAHSGSQHIYRPQHAATVKVA